MNSFNYSKQQAAIPQHNCCWSVYPNAGCNPVVSGWLAQLRDRRTGNHFHVLCTCLDRYCIH